MLVSKKKLILWPYVGQYFWAPGKWKMPGGSGGLAAAFWATRWEISAYITYLVNNKFFSGGSSIFAFCLPIFALAFYTGRWERLA